MSIRPEYLQLGETERLFSVLDTSKEGRTTSILLELV